MPLTPKDHKEKNVCTNAAKKPNTFSKEDLPLKGVQADKCSEGICLQL